MIDDTDVVVTDINIPFPEDEQLTLVIAVGACKVRVVPGSDAWVTGTYTAPEGVMPLKITQHDGTLKISQEIGIKMRMRIPPKFDLKLGAGRAYRLKLETGASDCSLDLGGLPITEMFVQQGAASLTIDFSAPNPVDMDQLLVESGAASVTIKNLSNAGFREMSVDGGAGSYTLDFGAAMRHDATLALQLGASSIDMTVPAALALAMKTETVMGSVSARGFEKRGNTYANQAAQDGTSPLLRVRAQMAMGSLSLRER